MVEHRTEFERLADFERRFLNSLRRRELAAKNVNILHAERLTLGDRVADRFAATMGSWRFIIIQSVILVIWVVLNVTAWIQHWDPYPFILLNLALSFQAAYAAPIIMMSQNRQEAKDRIRAEHDYEVNVKAELEIADLHAKIDALRTAQWEALIAMQQEQIVLLERIVKREA